jgi:hypothetical protein
MIDMLDSSVMTKYTEEQLAVYIDIALTIIESSNLEIDDDKLVLAVAVKTLSIFSIPENSSLSSKKIKDVEITYYGGQGKSKWDSMFDSIIDGSGTETSLKYVGI